LPVYREEISLPYLLKSISQLNYPKDKLDIQLLVEPDDYPTIKSILSIPYESIPGGYVEYIGDSPVANGKRPIEIRVWDETTIRITYIYLFPKNSRGKPKSLNKGLLYAKGEFLIIYDAEDRPQPDQLLKMAIYMRDHPEVTCLQAKLAYYNTDQSLLTKLFSIEYLNHFNILLPIIHNSELVVLLGGTSNFFRTNILKKLKGWDEKNVTEDADLGVRIARSGGKTIPFNSITWEEAPPKLYPWLRQRIRWNKGFIYTFKVHYKRPLSLIGDIGIKSSIFLLYQLISPVINMISLPGWVIFAIVWLNWAGVPLYPISEWISEAYDFNFMFYFTMIPFVVGVGFVFVITFLAMRESHYAKKKYFFIFLMPVYNILLSVAGLIAIIEFFFKPQVWHKTYHGFSMNESNDPS
jgi:cellulose synthase/poly-beta-1,6-N-acetylglucosamine synthase-like glycosyltransferase